MGQIIAIITLVNQLLPLILKTIETIELAFPAGGQGATKLAIVQGIVKEALATSTEVQVSAEKFLPVLTPIINGIVAMKNSTGLFKKA